MKTIKITVVFVVLLLTAWFLYQAFSSENNQTLSGKPVGDLSVGMDKKSSDLTTNHIVNNNSPALPSEKTIISPDFSTPSNFASALSHCGETPEQFYDELLKREDTTFSDKQTTIYDRYLERCDEWFEFQSVVDETTEQELKNQLKLENERALSLIQDDLSSESKQKAKNILKDNHISKLDSVALIYSLYNDWDFIKQIADEVGTENLNSIRMNAVDITSLYESNFTEFDEINQYEIDMLCLNDESYCVRSIPEYLQNSLTIDQYSDLVNISQAVLRVLRDGDP